MENNNKLFGLANKLTNLNKCNITEKLVFELLKMSALPTWCVVFTRILQLHRGELNF